ncbi:hypothetical protein LshimejAT787_1102560 [Lyophyllum shimeji]|uniref:Uncharacterized protein n=1 Tax=Lyophyllum shimeji TaxID=47721 RepID=A0A9P3PW09_LYOSH|nr:hypothetical protein LshimejAT787_1102560 [Lyophyllum shimeji]
MLPTPAKDPYYHLIPLFVLRRYQVESPSRSSNLKSARRRYRRPVQRGVESIFVYDIPTSTLSNKPFNRVYGSPDLYRDVSVEVDISALEEGLFALENHTSRIIEDLHLHKHGEFMLKRKDWYYLMKYLFIMHYRQTKLSSSYPREDYTRDGALPPWLWNLQEQHVIKTMADVWLFTMRYYMDTPHSLICQHAGEIHEKYGRDVVAKGVPDSHVEHRDALAYATQAQEYSPGFWEASEGTEFLLSHNGFGLEEGDCFMPSMTMHRIFVLSPRFAIVLRHNRMLSDSFLKSPSMGSKFADIKQHLPRLTCMDEAAEDEADIFAFRLTRLTKAQMQDFNSVILSKVAGDGSITFSSKEYILGVIQTHCRLLEHASDCTKYEPLIDALSPPTIFFDPPAGSATLTSNTNLYVALSNWYTLATKHMIGRDGMCVLDITVSTAGVSTATEYRALLELPVYKLLQKPIPKPTSRPSIARPSALPKNAIRVSVYTAEYATPDNEFRHVLAGIMDGSLTFRSRYDNAHRIFAMCNMSIHEGNPFATEVRRLTGFCIYNFRLASSPPPDFCPKPHAQIVESLSTTQSTTFFEVLDELMDKMGVEPGLVSLSRFLSDVVALRFLTWIVQNRQDTLPTLLPDINVMK